MGFVYGAVTRCGRPFHAGSTTRELCNSLGGRQLLPIRSHDPPMATPAGYHTTSV